MSDTLPEQETYLAKLRRMNAETEKFVAEQRKRIAEEAKFRGERLTSVLIAGAGIALAAAALGGVAVKLLVG